MSKQSREADTIIILIIKEEKKRDIESSVMTQKGSGIVRI